MPRARVEEGMCREHHCPVGECPPWSRHPHTVRARDDDWQGAQRANGHKDIADWIAVAMQTRRGYVRCPRCDHRDPGAGHVPLICGDMTGKTLDMWIDVAEKRVRAQHPRHEPVWLGAEPPGHVVPATPEPLLRARARNRPGAAVFMEPGSDPVITTVPEVRDRDSKKGRTAGDRLPR